MGSGGNYMELQAYRLIGNQENEGLGIKLVFTNQQRKEAEEFERSQWYDILETLLWQACGETLTENANDFWKNMGVGDCTVLFSERWFYNLTFFSGNHIPSHCFNYSTKPVRSHLWASPQFQGNLNLILPEALQTQRYKSEFIIFPQWLASLPTFSTSDWFCQLPKKPRIETCLLSLTLSALQLKSNWCMSY